MGYFDIEQIRRARAALGRAPQGARAGLTITLATMNGWMAQK